MFARGLDSRLGATRLQLYLLYFSMTWSILSDPVGTELFGFGQLIHLAHPSMKEAALSTLDNALFMRYSQGSESCIWMVALRRARLSKPMPDYDEGTLPSAGAWTMHGRDGSRKSRQEVTVTSTQSKPLHAVALALGGHCSSWATLPCSPRSYQPMTTRIVGIGMGHSKLMSCESTSSSSVARAS